MKAGKKIQTAKSSPKSREELFAEMEEFKKKSQYVKGISDTLKGKQLEQSMELDMAELKKAKTLEKNIVIKRVVPLLGIMVALPIVHANTRNIIEIVKTGAPGLPVGGFYEAKMYRLRSKILFAGYAAGWHEVKPECQKMILATYNAIKTAISILGDHPANKLESACVREFGLICLMAYQQLPMLGSGLPTNHAETVKHALKLLEFISDEPGIFELLNALRRKLSP